jgi:hypothetical protein
MALVRRNAFRDDAVAGQAERKLEIFLRALAGQEKSR